MRLDNVRLNRFVKCAALGSFFISIADSDIFAKEPYQRHVRKFEMPRLGIANPAGLAFSPSANAFIVAPNRDNADLEIVTFAREQDGSETVATAIADPVNMAFDGKSNSLLFFDASVEELVEIKAGTNGLPQPTADAITRFNGRRFNAKQARGMTIDPESGDLFILIVPGQPNAPKIVRITPDARSRFDGAVVSSIALDALRESELRGIAFNPSDGHLYVMSPAEQKLYKVNQKGEVLTTRDLSSFEFSDAQNMVFAPSGDQTDDPAIMSLYVADNGLSSKQGLGDITELSLTQSTVLDLSAVTAAGSLVRTILTSQWNPPSPDPSGITYIPSSNSLIIADGEVDEMQIFRGVNYWQVGLSGNQINEYRTTAFSDEPTGVACNPNNGHLFFIDDTGTRTVYELNQGSDGRYNTSDDKITSFKTSGFGVVDPEGIAYDTFQGHLFIADGSNAEVWEIAPGANGRFNGAPSNGGDDVLVNHFDTSRLGLSDPESVEFNTNNGNLYIVSRSDGIVVETTRAGTAVGVIDIGFLNARSPAGLAYAPSSVNPSEKSLYIVARGVDNDSNPKENDGKMYEISLGASGPPPRSIVINNVAVTEGNNGTVNAVFSVTLSASSSQTVTVNYATANGSAIAGSDYVAVSGQVSFSPGQTSRPVTVVVNGDVIGEPNETFFVNLSNAANATIGDGQGAGTITNDDGVQQSMTVSFQNGVDGYTGTLDTKLLNNTPTTNYGSATAIELDGSPDIAGLLSWNLTSLPSGSTIQSVDITVNLTNFSTHTYEIYEMKRPWIEGQATWNVYASGLSWQVAGANGSEDRGATELGALTAASTGLQTFSLNSAGVALLQSWVDNPSSNHGFVIMDYIGATDGLNFSSREHGTVSKRPKLTVTYSGTSPPNVSLEPMSEPETPAPSAEVLPQMVALNPNYPNPFNLETRIEYALPEQGRVSLAIYNIRGQHVRELVDEIQPGGFKSVMWNGRDNAGREVGSGVYFIRLIVGQNSFVRRIALQK